MTAAPRDFEAAPLSSAAPRPIAVLMSRFPSVTETFILREMIEMERQGQPVRLVPMLEEFPPVIHAEARLWNERALHTPYVSTGIIAANLRAFLRNPIRYLALIARLKLGTIRSPGMFARTLALFPKSVFLAEQLTREGIRHIHAHYATHPATMALIISKLSDITFSFTVHAHDIQVDRSLLGWKLRETRFVRSISAFNREYLERLYPHAKGKIEVIHVGIDPHVYETTGDQVSPSTGTIRILTVAAHKPYKGLPVLIEACARLRDEGYVFRCDIVGHGPMHDELERMIGEKGLGHVVHLVGPKPQDEVARMMAEATLFVLPSIVAPDGQMEGIPVALMEAMATGRAAVSTKISGIPELIDHGANGLLVPPSNPSALAGAIRTLLVDREGARQLGERGRAKVRAEFAIDSCVAKLIERLSRENR